MGIMLNQYNVLDRALRKKQYLSMAFVSVVFIGLMYVTVGGNKGIIGYGVFGRVISPVITLLSEVFGSMFILVGGYFGLLHNTIYELPIHIDML